MADAVAPSDVHQSFALLAPRQGLPTLMRVELWRTSEAHAALLSALAALASPGADQFALELGQAAKHREHQSTVRARCVGPGVLEALKPGTPLGERRNDVEQVSGRARQPVEPGDKQHVAGLAPAQKHVSRRPI